MTENTDTTNKRSIWLRAIYMLLMAFAFNVAVTVICVVAVIQFLLVLLNDTPNDRLLVFGRGLGRYIQQIVSFLTFAAEEVPFPFSDWPAGD